MENSNNSYDLNNSQINNSEHCSLGNPEWEMLFKHMIVHWRNT